MATDNQNRTRNINEASEADLRALPFMNEQRAKLIMNYIDSQGPITSAAQLDDIPNIGEKLSQLISSHFDFDDNSNSNNDSDSRRSGNRAVSASDDDDSDGRSNNRGGSNKASGSSTADDGDGRRNNPGRPAGIPRDAKYSDDDSNGNDNNRGNGNKSR